MLELTDATFDETVSTAEGVALVDIWAEWCPPCKNYTPVLEAVEEETDTTVFSLDADINPATMIRFGIKSIPTTLVYKDGKRLDTWVGYIKKSDLLDRIAQL